MFKYKHCDEFKETFTNISILLLSSRQNSKHLTFIKSFIPYNKPVL